MSTTLPDTIERRIAPIEMSGETFRTAGHALVDQVATWLDGLRDGTILRDESVTDVRHVLGAERTLPASGCAPGPLLDETAAMLFDHSVFNGHPRFFGYITSSPAPIGALADLLASAINQNVGAWRRWRPRSRRRPFAGLR